MKRKPITIPLTLLQRLLQGDEQQKGITATLRLTDDELDHLEANAEALQHTYTPRADGYNVARAAAHLLARLRRDTQHKEARPARSSRTTTSGRNCRKPRSPA